MEQLFYPDDFLDVFTPDNKKHYETIVLYIRFSMKLQDASFSRNTLKFHVIRRMIFSYTFLKPPPLGLTGICHFYCRPSPAGREARILDSVGTAPRCVFRMRDTSREYVCASLENYRFISIHPFL